MLKLLRIISLIAMLGAGSTAVAAVKAPTPRIAMAAAKAMALKLAPGKIISSEYEKEGGIWRYSFDIQQQRQRAGNRHRRATGRVVENKSEGKVDHD